MDKTEASLPIGSITYFLLTLGRLLKETFNQRYLRTLFIALRSWMLPAQNYVERDESSIFVLTNTSDSLPDFGLDGRTLFIHFLGTGEGCCLGRVAVQRMIESGYVPSAAVHIILVPSNLNAYRSAQDYLTALESLSLHAIRILKAKPLNLVLVGLSKGAIAATEVGRRLLSRRVVARVGVLALSPAIYRQTPNKFAASGAMIACLSPLMAITPRTRFFDLVLYAPLRVAQLLLTCACLTNLGITDPACIQAAVMDLKSRTPFDGCLIDTAAFRMLAQTPASEIDHILQKAAELIHARRPYSWWAVISTDDGWVPYTGVAEKFQRIRNGQLLANRTLAINGVTHSLFREGSGRQTALLAVGSAVDRMNAELEFFGARNQRELKRQQVQLHTQRVSVDEFDAMISFENHEDESSG